jgi:hypothetical protein
MDLDNLLHRYFDTADLDTLDEAALTRGREQLAIDFGVEQEPSRKFALWVLMEGLGIAPLPADAFKKDAMLKAAAEDYLSAAWKVERDA